MYSACWQLALQSKRQGLAKWVEFRVRSGDAWATEECGVLHYHERLLQRGVSLWHHMAERRRGRVCCTFQKKDGQKQNPQGVSEQQASDGRDLKLMSDAIKALRGGALLLGLVGLGKEREGFKGLGLIKVTPYAVDVRRAMGQLRKTARYCVDARHGQMLARTWPSQVVFRTLLEVARTLSRQRSFVEEGLQVSLSLGLKGILVYTSGVLFHVEWHIREP